MGKKSSRVLRPLFVDYGKKRAAEQCIDARRGQTEVFQPPAKHLHPVRGFTVDYPPIEGNRGFQ